MNDLSSSSAGWFAGVDPGDPEAAAAAVSEGEADEPRDWPALAVESGFAADEDEYYDRLHEATVRAAREAAQAAERADDQQLIHSLRAMDDAERTANELAERLEEWAGALLAVETDASGLDFAAVVADYEPTDATEERAVSLAQRAVDLREERDDLRAFVERRAPEVAPNLAEMAGPVLAARLISLAGGLESLAKKPSGTVQVLGAEDALFAHLRGHAPSPKHGVIFTHEFVRGTRPEDRGSAARALAGKLSIAARIDHYAGERRESVHEDLRDRMATIRARADGDTAGEDDDDTEENDE
ncbi:NOP58 family protein [Halolamina sp. CBA1230]|uniref:NOP5/NOP56 family protein n=1 Tax=Halolamina sp. CBA1230 TaxID=1853690 RepID=UPI0009A20602|nr:NOP5/NOP56 family protein [Halolamina sp. CBA1230]QKY19612.1 NOP58 family protein [Halolamina sp. CBA1230]